MTNLYYKVVAVITHETLAEADSFAEALALKERFDAETANGYNKYGRISIDCYTRRRKVAPLVCTGCKSPVTL